MTDSGVGIAITVALSLISLYFGMAAAGAQQDRDAIRKQRGIAKALLADLERVDSELARMRATGLVPWTGRPPVPAPTIHPWIEGLIAQIADEAPEVIAGFMRLERSLATLAEITERARQAYASVDHAFDHFQRLETSRRADFARGKYDPEHDSFLPPEPTELFDGLPDDMADLIALSSIDATAKPQCARAKIAWIEARVRLEDALRDYVWQPKEAMTFILALEERLSPIARRPIPTLPQLAFKTGFPVVEDAEVDRLADQEAVREFRSGRGPLV